MEIQLQQFQIRPLELIETVQKTGEEIILTEQGQAIAKIVPLQPLKPGSFLGSMAGSVEVKGDIIAPIEETWEVDA
ncbi:MAG: type II toxin-antitoxin system Phd/YefM family antitoxin [Synechocystis sp.]|jgi:antitoxin (DNA-binding transcriptional repressor) of toxin-antitoxin stability system